MSIGIVLLLSILFGYVASTAARKKRRDPVRWFILGFLFGPLSFVVFALPPLNEDRE